MTLCMNVCIHITWVYKCCYNWDTNHASVHHKPDRIWSRGVGRAGSCVEDI